jgi:hypothetical protein
MRLRPAAALNLFITSSLVTPLGASIHFRTTRHPRQAAAWHE